MSNETKGAIAVRMRDAGLSNAEIAAVLGMSKDSTRRLISETRKAARSQDSLAYFVNQLQSGEEIEFSDDLREMAQAALARQQATESTTTATTTSGYAHADWSAFKAYKSQPPADAIHDNPGSAWLGEMVSRKIAALRKATHLIVPDTQCKPGVPLEHLEWAGRYAAERKPDVIIHLGDHWDMPSLSSYEKKGSRYFEGRRVKEDIEVGNEGLRLFEKGLGGWQPKRKILLRGNHEDRITRAINEDPKAEGLFGFGDFNDVELGWEIIDYLVPIEVDGITYSHYFYRNGSGTPFGGAVDTMLRNIGFSFTMGHQQGLRWGRRELPNGHVQIGLVAGSYYQHSEDYRGPQAAAEWRGLVVKFEVAEGNYDPLFVSMDYLRNRFGS